VPTRGGVRGPVGSMGRGWPDYHWIQIPTVRTDTLDRGHYRTLYTRASIASQIVLTDKDFDGTKHT
jgi:hypothetical protein